MGAILRKVVCTVWIWFGVMVVLRGGGRRHFLRNGRANGAKPMAIKQLAREGRVYRGRGMLANANTQNGRCAQAHEPKGFRGVGGRQHPGYFLKEAGCSSCRLRSE